MKTQLEEQFSNFDHYFIVEELYCQMSESNQQIKRDCKRIKESIERFKRWKEQHLPLQSKLAVKPSQVISYKTLKE